MTSTQAWPDGDREWVGKYRMSMIGKHVPPAPLEERERELLDTVHDMKAPAEELFGDPEELAAEDAAELATADEAVRTSLGGGLQPALKEVGGVLTGIGTVSALLVFIGSGWSVDIDTAHALVAAGVLVVFVGWVVGRALFSAGRLLPAVGALSVVAELGAARALEEYRASSRARLGEILADWSYEEIEDFSRSMARLNDTAEGLST